MNRICLTTKTLIVLTASCLLGLTATAHAQYAYDITSLGYIGPSAFPYALNNNGQIVGSYVSPKDNQVHAFLYDKGQMRDLFPIKRGDGANSLGLNDRGQIAATDASGPFVYSLSTDSRKGLGITPTPLTAAHGINQNGDVAGSYDSHAFLYHNNTGTYQDLGAVPGGINDSIAYALNNVGQVTGTAGIGIGSHAFIYSNGAMQDIGLLPGGRFAEGRAINDHGDVAGQSDYGGTINDHAFVYRNSVMTDIGLLHSYDNNSEAFGINNAGDVVGQSGYTGFLYHNNQLLSLDSLIDPSLGWSITSGLAINQGGQIIGYGNQGMFVMTPRAAVTPAPGSLLVCGLGGGLLVLRLRRRCR